MINDTFRQYRQQASDGGTSQLLSSTETSNDGHMEDTGDFHNFLKDGSEKLYEGSKELGNFKPFVRIKSQLEGSIAKGHIAEETLTFFSQYMEDTETRFNRPRRVRDDPNYIQPSGMSTIFPQLSSSDENLRQAELPYYGKLEDIIEINMDDSRLFFSNVNGLILLEIEEHEPYIEASQAQLVSYVDDILNKGWSVVVHLKPRDMYDMGEVLEEEVYENEPYKSKNLNSFLLMVMTMYK
ncbi:hypothetical protein KY289_000765 [Solanum tuberosum]|nr:hypothetical protein KY289_000765 [Solanum tuberosum]